MNCCTNTYDLGCFDSCDTITLPFAFEQNGTHKIQFETQFRFKYSITGVANEDVELDLTIFPENQFIYWRMINPDGTPFTYAVGSAYTIVFQCVLTFIKMLNIHLWKM